MSEKDVLFSKVNIVKNCLFAIEKVKAQEKDESFRIGLFELNLQRAIQACIDLANLTIAKEGLGLPNSYRQSMEILANHQVISPVLAMKMKSMIGFRNISVHDYAAVKPEIVQSIVEKHLTDFEEYYSVLYDRAVKNWG
jgi:uncharacterized protein YutE (UPF0331/DUF86 family)